MRYSCITLGLGLLALAYAQYNCAPCNVSNTLPPRTFDPPYLVIEAGRDTDVVIQFALPETVVTNGITVYPNFAIYVDSLRLDGGNTHVALYGTTDTPAQYNSGNPAAGAMRFDQDHRYKQVRSSAPTHDNVVVYRNPGGGSPSSPTPPRGCVRACIRGVTPTGNGADTLRIFLRGFVDPNSINIFTGQANDINNKDTTNLMPMLGGTIPLYSDVWSGYPVRVTASTSTVHSSYIQGLTLTPNPAWGSATLSYTLNHPTALSLRILTLAGQEIEARDLGWRTAGTHELSLSLPAGIYLIELRAGQEKQIQRLVVL